MVAGLISTLLLVQPAEIVAIRASVDGKHVAWVERFADGMRVVTPSEVEPTFAQVAPESLVFSQSGSIAYLAKVGAQDEVERVVYQGVPDRAYVEVDPSSLAFSPSGKKLAYFASPVRRQWALAEYGKLIGDPHADLIGRPVFGDSEVPLVLARDGELFKPMMGEKVLGRFAEVDFRSLAVVGDDPSYIGGRKLAIIKVEETEPASQFVDPERRDDRRREKVAWGEDALGRPIDAQGRPRPDQKELKRPDISTVAATDVLWVRGPKVEQFDWVTPARNLAAGELQFNLLLAQRGDQLVIFDGQRARGAHGGAVPGSLVVGPDGTLAYLTHRRGRYRVVVGTKEEAPYRLIALPSLSLAKGGIPAYAASADGKTWTVVRGEDRFGSFDSVEPFSIKQSGNGRVVAFQAMHDGKRWIVVNHNVTEAPSDTILYLSEDGQDVFLVGRDRIWINGQESGPYEDIRVLRQTGEPMFAMKREGRWTVRISRQRTETFEGTAVPVLAGDKLFGVREGKVCWVPGS